MKKQNFEKKQKLITRILLGVYLIVLAWIILMKTELTFEGLNNIRDINLIPFDKLTIINGRTSYREFYLNILVFAPFGLYISMLKPNWSFIKKIYPIILVSFLFETLQYVFAIGASDITDFIANVTGGLIGIIFYFIISKLSKDKQKLNKALNILASIATTGFIILSSILILGNM